MGAHHPAYRPVGTVRHDYRKVHALSVDLDPGESLATGQTLAIRLAEGVREFAWTELQVERVPVQKTLPAFASASGSRLGATKWSCERPSTPCRRSWCRLR